MMTAACSIVIPVVMELRPHSDSMDRAPNARHRGECTARRETGDGNEGLDLAVISIDERYLARGTQADWQCAVDYRLATAKRVGLVVASARYRLQQDCPQPGNGLGYKVDQHHFIAERRGAESERTVPV
jgi:hypothetical protein